MARQGAQDVGFFREMAELALSGGDVASARRALRRVLELNGADAEASAILAEIDIAEGDFAAAKTTLAAGLAANPSHDALFLRLRQITAGGDAVDPATSPRRRLAALCDPLSRDRGDPLHLRLLRSRFAHSATAWDVYGACMQERWAEAGGASGTARGLGFATGRIDLGHLDAISAAFDAAPIQPLSPLDAAPGWAWDPSQGKQQYAADHLLHRRPDEAFLRLLESALSAQVPALEAAFGCWLRLPSLRIFSMKAGANICWHYDGWPQSLCKLYLYLDGADLTLGTTLLRCHDGVERAVTLPPGGWALFEASACEHTGVAPAGGVRRAIEFAVAPAPRTDVRLCDAGLNAAIPWSPFEAQPETAQPPRLGGAAVGGRLRRRSVEDACGATRTPFVEPPDGT